MDKINVMPSKNLLIDTLTEDISIHDAVLDLLDNAVDSYIRNNIKDRRKIELKISKDQFEIIDNCGGINAEQLKQNIFRIGLVDIKKKAPTIGRFGVGLKRSLFKIGKKITFITDDGKNESSLDIDINKWMNTDEWTFDGNIKASNLKENQLPYTSIKISELNEETKESFDITFENLIKRTIEKYYTRFINDKIDFYVNGNKQAPYDIEIKTYDNLTPAKLTTTYEGVTIEIICWINAKIDKKLKFTDQEKSGWNIFMNDRLVINSDTSASTGWTGKNSELPKFHFLYNQFMGIVNLYTKEPQNLPINTSKTGFNEESKIYKHIRSKMIETARPLITYLNNKKKNETDKKEELEEEIELNFRKESKSLKETEIKKYKINDLPKNQDFKAPTNIVQYEQVIPTTNICFTIEKSLLEKLMNLYGMNKKELAEYIFEYFLKSEGLTDED